MFLPIQKVFQLPTMRIDPGNKFFITIFSVVVLGVIGFLIASIFINFGDDVEVQTIKFGKSNFAIKVIQLKSDKKSYVAQVYNGKIPHRYQSDNSACSTHNWFLRNDIWHECLITFVLFRRETTSRCAPGNKFRGQNARSHRN